MGQYKIIATRSQWSYNRKHEYVYFCRKSNDALDNSRALALFTWCW